MLTLHSFNLYPMLGARSHGLRGEELGLMLTLHSFNLYPMLGARSHGLRGERGGFNVNFTFI